MYNGIGKIWGGGIQVIRDEYSEGVRRTSCSSRRTSTLDYDVVRPDGYLQVEFFE